MTGFRLPRPPQLRSLSKEDALAFNEWASALVDEAEYGHLTVLNLALNPWGYQRGGRTGNRFYSTGVSGTSGTTLAIYHALVTTPGVVLVTPQASVGPFYVSVNSSILNVHWAVSCSARWSWEAVL